MTALAEAPTGGTGRRISSGDAVAASEGGAWLHEVRLLDGAGYAAIAATPTPVLDSVFRRLSRAADHWKLWLGSAAALGIAGGPRGRRAAVDGVAAMAISSAVVHVVLKPLGGRRRPDRVGHQVPVERHDVIAGCVAGTTTAQVAVALLDRRRRRRTALRNPDRQTL